ncbi:MAG TPA: YtxH domain-containing protein [Gemmatimonadaceae bacterium]|nr:YtxH domain-containing protein [Gemmatimonadaceae bacterium]
MLVIRVLEETSTDTAALSKLLAMLACLPSRVRGVNDISPNRFPSFAHNDDPNAAEANVSQATSDDADVDDEQVNETDPEGSGVAMFAGGLMLGLAVGAGLALLMAPQAGDETRRLIRRRARRLGEHMSDRVEDIRDDIRRSARKGEKKLRQSLNLS